MKLASAKGMKGFLINGQFRVYKENGDFVDYDIAHSDLHIKIVDSDAYFYSSDTNEVLDHSPQTLGIKLTKEEK